MTEKQESKIEIYQLPTHCKILTASLIIAPTKMTEYMYKTHWVKLSTIVRTINWAVIMNVDTQ